MGEKRGSAYIVRDKIIVCFDAVEKIYKDGVIRP